MSLLNRGLSAIGKLIALGAMAAVFIVGMATVVYMSLQGTEIKVPEITGKNFAESERELASLGLKIKKRADRVSPEPPNTVVEQLPKAGETVKTGQMILVVISKAAGEGDETPSVLKKTNDEDDTEKIEEMISDKPKKPKANANTNRKKADTTRDVLGNNTDSNSNSSSSNSNKKDPGSNNNSSTNSNKSNQTPGTKPPAGNSARPNDGRLRLSNRP